MGQLHLKWKIHFRSLSNISGDKVVRFIMKIFNQVQAKKKVLNSKNRSSKRSNLFLNKSEIKIQTAHYSIMIGINASPASISL